MLRMRFYLTRPPLSSALGSDTIWPVISKSIVASGLALAFLIAAATGYRRRRSRAAGLLLLSAGCFVVVAAVHVFEAFGVFGAAGWGKPTSVGHYVDLSGAVLGAMLAIGSLATALGRRRRKETPTRTLPSGR